MNLKSLRILALSYGLIYVWFGALKFFPGLSPAETIAQNTLNSLTFNLLPQRVGLYALALWEVSLGLLFLANRLTKVILICALIHLLFTLSTLFLFPDQLFGDIPFQLTLLGQYVIKNVILLAGIIYLYRNFFSV